MTSSEALKKLREAFETWIAAPDVGDVDYIPEHDEKLKQDIIYAVAGYLGVLKLDREGE